MKLTPQQQLTLSRSTIRIRLGKWWGNKHGYEGRHGGWIYRPDGRCLIQGWHNFYLRYRHQIWTEIEGPTDAEYADALRACTGAVKVTLREQVRMADGTLRTVSETVSEKRS